MQDLLASLPIAVVVFATTNIDDILLLALFFADPSLRARSVIIGQYLGIGALVAVSAAAALAALVIPPGWTALLGLAPLLLGIRGLLQLRRSKDLDDQEDTAAAEQERSIETKTHSQSLAIA